MQCTTRNQTIHLPTISDPPETVTYSTRDPLPFFSQYIENTISICFIKIIDTRTHTLHHDEHPVYDVMVNNCVRSKRERENGIREKYVIESVFVEKFIPRRCTIILYNCIRMQ